MRRPKAEDDEDYVERQESDDEEWQVPPSEEAVGDMPEMLTQDQDMNDSQEPEVAVVRDNKRGDQWPSGRNRAVRRSLPVEAPHSAPTSPAPLRHPGWRKKGERKRDKSQAHGA